MRGRAGGGEEMDQITVARIRFMTNFCFPRGGTIRTTSPGSYPRNLPCIPETKTMSDPVELNVGSIEGPATCE